MIQVLLPKVKLELELWPSNERAVSGGHRYVFVLFRQPQSVDISRSSLTDFNAHAFALE